MMPIALSSLRLISLHKLLCSLVPCWVVTKARSV